MTGAPHPLRTNLSAGISETASALRALLERRRSCRGYLQRQVPRPVIEKLLEMAQLTPSWCNTQPWRVIVTSGQGTERLRIALSTAAGASAAPDIPFPREYLGVHQSRRLASAQQLYESVGARDRGSVRRQVEENFRLFGAPHVAIVTTDEALGCYGAIDCGAYVATFMLAAESLGLSCVAQASIAARGPIVRAFFDLPPAEHVVCGVSFGCGDDTHPANGFRTPRADLAEVVRWVDA